MSTRANGHWTIGANEHFGQMGVWDKWACGDWDKWMFGKWAFGGKWAHWDDEFWSKWAFGENGHLGGNGQQEK